MMLAKRSFVFFVCCLLLILSPREAQAVRCKQGLEMAYLVAASDAIVVIEITSVPLLQTQLVRNANYSFSVVSVIKPALVRPLEKLKKHALRINTGKYQKLRRGQKYFAFLRYESGNTWSSSPCLVLALTGAGAVRDACTVVSDLFKKNPYEREKRCLLSYPPDVPYEELKKEFLGFLTKEYKYSGVARITDVGAWVEGSPFQHFEISLTARERKKFFPASRLISSKAIRVYIPSSTAPSKEEYIKFMRVGKRIEIRGVWTMGSFVVEFLK
jgi:hypothetical protein